MKNFEDWSQLVAKNLQGEADLITAIGKDELDDDAARIAFVSAVLEPFLPKSFAIGAGKVVDAEGNYSQSFDIVIYNRDFPKIGLKSTQSTYLLESVLAAFVIRGKLLRKPLLEAMDTCASLAALDPVIDKPMHQVLAKKYGMTINKDGSFSHSDALRAARFHLIGRPPTFIYGFTGIKNSYKQLAEHIEVWLGHQQDQHKAVELKDLPAVIATQGCFAWRNSAPLAVKSQRLLGLGADTAPVRLIIMQLMHLLNRRLSTRSDSFGLKPNLSAYLKQFTNPAFDLTLGKMGQNNIRKAAAEAKAAAPVIAEKPAAPAADEEPAAVEPSAASSTAATPAPAPVKEAPAATAEPEPPAPVVEAPPAEPAPEPVVASNPEPPAEPAPKPEPAVAEPVPAAVEAAAEPEAEAPQPVTAEAAAKPAPEPEPATAAKSSRAPANPLGDVSGLGSEDKAEPEDYVPEFIVEESFPEGVSLEDEAPAQSHTAALNEPDFPTLEDPAEEKEAEFQQTVVMEQPEPSETHTANEIKAAINEYKEEKQAAAPAPEADDKENAEEDQFEQTLVLRAPIAQEKPKDTAAQVADRARKSNGAAAEPFPHLAPETPEEVDPFTSTIPQ